MAAINIQKYFSQKDGDTGPYKGTCGEACLKMIDHYLTGREVPISAIVEGGDKNGAITNFTGMIDAANWLGFGVVRYSGVTAKQIQGWLSEGKLLVAAILYSKWPSKYKQDTAYTYGHFILITGITDDLKAIRFADPYFWGNRREEGWMNNNKWATWDDFYTAFYHNTDISQNGSVVVSKIGKTSTPPTPPPDPCASVRAELDQRTKALDVANNHVKEVEVRNGVLTEQNEQLTKAGNELRDSVVTLTGQVEFLNAENNRLRDSFAVAEGQVKEKTEEIARLEGEKEQLEQSVSLLNGQIVGLKAKIGELENATVENLTTGELISIVLRRILR